MNADFDLTLAHGGGKIPAKILEAARGMAWHFWPALPETDTLIVPAPPPASFLAYLAACGLRPPRFVVEGSDSALQSGAPKNASRLFTPFGWNEEAHLRNALYHPSSQAPDPAVVKKVNSRAFSAVKEREIFSSAACPAIFFKSPKTLKTWLEAAPPGRYVAKGNHGLAGIGQIRFEIPAAQPAEDGLFKVLSRLCNRMEGVVLEEEQRVLTEFGVLFHLSKTGNISTIRIHHLLCGIDGNFSGAWVVPHGEPDPILDPWRNLIEESAARIASVLCEEGYFGPVGIDMYVTEKNGRMFLRPLVDLNARCSMAWPVHGLAQCFQGRAVMVENFASSRFKMANDLDGMTSARNKLHFDTKRLRGFVWLTPLVSSKRHSLAFVGNDATDVMNVRNMTIELLALKGKI